MNKFETGKVRNNILNENKFVISNFVAIHFFFVSSQSRNIKDYLLSFYIWD